MPHKNFNLKNFTAQLFISTKIDGRKTGVVKQNGQS
jgi:hypothetical protein